MRVREAGGVSERVEVVPGDRDGELMVRVDGYPQSLVDLTDPTRLVFDYVRRAGDVIDASAPAGEPLRALHVGGAGLTLPRYVAATRPGSRQIVLEPDQELISLVRDRLPLPRRSGISVRPVDGATGVGAVSDDWAALVVLDAYQDGAVPAELLGARFLADLVRVLAPGAVAVLNIVDAAPFGRVRAAVAGLQEAGRRPGLLVSAEPATLRGRRPGNLLVVAGADPTLAAALRSRAERSVAPYRVVSGGEVADRFGGG